MSKPKIRKTSTQKALVFLMALCALSIAFATLFSVAGGIFAESKGILIFFGIIFAVCLLAYCNISKK